jgi:hypothetical protein
MIEYITVSLTEFNRSMNKYLRMINENRYLILKRRNGDSYMLRQCTPEEIKQIESIP